VKVHEGTLTSSGVSKSTSQVYASQRGLLRLRLTSGCVRSVLFGVHTSWPSLFRRT
jgi:hypothetical protein